MLDLENEIFSKFHRLAKTIIYLNYGKIGEMYANLRII